MLTKAQAAHILIAAENYGYAVGQLATVTVGDPANDLRIDAAKKNASWMHEVLMEILDDYSNEARGVTNPAPMVS